ncbi:MAG: hypothetical protein ACMUIA_05870 [bacterium]
MKRLIVSIMPLMALIAFIFLLLGPRAENSAAEMKVRTGFNYDWWERDLDSGAGGITGLIDDLVSWVSGGDPNMTEPEAIKGTQLYVPIIIDGRYQDFSFSLLTAYTSTQVDLSNGKSKSLTTLLDTRVNLAYELLDRFPVDTLLGLDINLPTGQTNLEEDDLDLMMDSDLVSINQFGEGLNINPTLNLARKWKDWMAGLGIGYVFRGKYDFSSGTRNFDPGDIINFTAEIVHDLPVDWQIRLFSNYAYYGKDKVGGEDYYQEGDLFLFGLGLDYRQDRWDGNLTLTSISRGDGELLDADWLTSRLATEASKSHGDELIVDLSMRYFLSNRTTLRSMVELLQIGASDYELSSFFVGKRQKISLEAGAATQLYPNLEGELKVRGFLMEKGETLFWEGKEYKGFSIEARLSTRF